MSYIICQFLLYPLLTQLDTNEPSCCQCDRLCLVAKQPHQIKCLYVIGGFCAIVCFVLDTLLWEWKGGWGVRAEPTSIRSQSHHPWMGFGPLGCSMSRIWSSEKLKVNEKRQRGCFRCSPALVKLRGLNRLYTWVLKKGFCLVPLRPQREWAACGPQLMIIIVLECGTGYQMIT